jgi:hypothetical protein
MIAGEPACVELCDEADEEFDPPLMAKQTPSNQKKPSY